MAVGHINERDHVKVKTRNGEEHEGSVVRITETEIVLRGRGKKETIIKRPEVTMVDYIRYEPASDSTEFWLSDGVLLTPGTWVYAMGTWPRMSVRLYDSSKQEDNTPHSCKDRHT